MDGISTGPFSIGEWSEVILDENLDACVFRALYSHTVYLLKQVRRRLFRLPTSIMRPRLSKVSLQVLSFILRLLYYVIYDVMNGMRDLTDKVMKPCSL